MEKEDRLSRTSVLDMKFGLERRGWRKRFEKAPAVVTDVSWPSFAILVSSVRGRPARQHLLMFGVMNIH